MTECRKDAVVPVSPGTAVASGVTVVTHEVRTVIKVAERHVVYTFIGQVRSSFSLNTAGARAPALRAA